METNNTWDSLLTFPNITVDRVYREAGIRDVLTTLMLNGVVEASEDRGITTLSGGEERGSVGLSGLGSGNNEAPQRTGFSQVPINLSTLDMDEGTENTRPERVENQPNNGGDDRVANNSNENFGNTMSLNDLFNRRSRVTNLDENTEMTLSDIQDTDLATTYTRPNLNLFTDPNVQLVEFGEDVVVSKLSGRDASVLEVSKKSYVDFNEESIDERNGELRRERERMNRGSDIQNKVQDIINDLFGGNITSMYGYNKAGRFDDGRPYIKAVLATRFNKLYDRRFRKPEERTSHTNNMDVAVANRLQSVKAYLELTIKGEANGDLVAEVTDLDGERVPYLEQKLSWLQESNVSPNMWVLLLKTQYEMEDTITTLDDLKNRTFRP